MTLENITHIPGPTLRGKLSDTFVRTTKGGVTTTKLTFIVEGSLGPVEETELIEIAKHGALCTVNGFKYEKPKPASAELTPAAAGNEPAIGQSHSDHETATPPADKNDPKNIPATDLQKAVDAIPTDGKTDVAPAFQKAFDQAAASNNSVMVLTNNSEITGLSQGDKKPKAPKFQCPDHPTSPVTSSYPAACNTCGQRLEEEPGIPAKFDGDAPPTPCPEHPNAMPWRASRAKPWRCGKCKRTIPDQGAITGAAK